MLNKVKIEVTREDAGENAEPIIHFLSDDDTFFVAKTDGNSIETWKIQIQELLELTISELNKLDEDYRQAICKGYGVTIYRQ